MSPLRLRLTIFVALAVIAIGYTGARYAQVTDWIFPTDYTVTVDLPTSGGIFPGAQVTYRGVPIGRVSEVTLTPSGVRAALRIGNSWRVPADVTAHVYDRSVVGEQYVDLIPTSAGGPDLHEGSTIQPIHATTPVSTEQLIQSLDALVNSVGTSNLHTVVTQLGTALGGRGDEVASILDNSSHLVHQAAANLPQTLNLVNNASTVLSTQLSGASDLRSFAQNLALLTDTVRGADPALRTLLTDGPVLAQHLTNLIQALSDPLPLLLNGLIGVNNVLVPNLGDLANGMSIAPWDVAAVQALVRNGRSYLGLSTNPTPLVCQKGYIPPSQWRSVNDLSPVPAPAGPYCAESGKNWRGSAQAH